MHAGVPEVDVHQIGRPALQQLDDHLQLAAIIHRREPPEVFQEKALHEILPRAREQLDLLERKALLALPLPREHKGLVPLQARSPAGRCGASPA